MTRGNVVPTCEAPLEHSEAKQPDVTLETLSVAEGYWRATNDSVNILACYNVDACVGGQTGAEEFCAQGYTGPCEGVVRKHAHASALSLRGRKRDRFRFVPYFFLTSVLHVFSCVFSGSNLSQIVLFASLTIRRRFRTPARGARARDARDSWPSPSSPRSC